MDLEVFIDESGSFCEGSAVPEELARYRQDKGASQLVATVAPRGWLTAPKVHELFKNEFSVWGVTRETGFHATELKKRRGVNFSDQVVSIAKTLASHKCEGLLIFRLTNSEKVCFGNRRRTYAVMLAELLTKICRKIQQLKTGGRGPQEIKLHIVQAAMKRMPHEGLKPVWDFSDYKPTIESSFLRMALSEGLKVQQIRLASFELRDARSDARLWVSDLVSNATYREMGSLEKRAQTALEDLLGENDLSLSVNTTLEKARDLAARQAFGLALIELAEKHASDWSNKETKEQCFREGEKVAAQLFLQPLEIHANLQMMATWLQQKAEDRSLSDSIRKCCEWMRKIVLVSWPTDPKASDTNYRSWFDLALRSTELTLCNHNGKIREGAEIARRINELIPRLAGRWEFAPDLLLALIRQSVHYNDCFEFEQSATLMKKVADYYQELGKLFQSMLPEVFPAEVRSHRRGAALGTLLQSQIGLVNLGRLSPDVARQTNEAAINEFGSVDDKLRQHQYRSELEATAGQWLNAREHLGLGLDAKDCSHLGLSKQILSLSENQRGFPLLHWTRIGALAVDFSLLPDYSDEDRFAAREEWSAFLTAWRDSGLGESEWSRGEKKIYPVHNILRRLAGVHAATGDVNEVLRTLSLLRKVNEAASPAAPLLLLLEAVAVLHSTAVLGMFGRADARQIISANSQTSQPVGLLETVLFQVGNTSATPSGQLSQTINSLLAQARLLCEGQNNFSEVLLACRQIGY